MAQFIQYLSPEREKEVYDQYKCVEEKIQFYKTELNDVSFFKLKFLNLIYFKDKPKSVETSK